MKELYYFLIFIYFLFGGLAALTSFSQSTKFPFFTVQSGSMKPKLPKGSLIITHKQNSYSKGDIITFKNQPQTKYETKTHRIIDKEKKDNKTIYLTQGDANEFKDQRELGEKYIVGKVLFHIPLIGFFINLISTNNLIKLIFLSLGGIIVLKESFLIYKTLSGQ